MIRAAAVILTFLTVVAASAQQPLFDPDDFLDLRTTGGQPVLISRLVTGAGTDMTDSFRPLGEHVGYLHLANSFYWQSLQFDYNRSELRAEGGEAAQWQSIAQGEERGLQQTRNATPKSKDTLHAAWYWPIPGQGGVPVMLRSRVTFAAQPVETTLSSFNGVTHMSGRERTFAIDTDTWFRVAGHDVFGSLALS
ncbi:MAG TPA: hypothetical protein VNN08_04430, partial [Thermoanaerobaculia bacterium]|nr:hypothetical protein [Thermoanaerobaculia bacterium]